MMSQRKILQMLILQFLKVSLIIEIKHLFYHLFIVPKLGVRHTMTILLHTFLACTFLTRSSLSLAIVAMTNSTTSSNPDIPVNNQDK